MNIQLVCWHCGKSTSAEVSQPPQFAFQLAGWANDVGMLGVLDLANSRSLVFCDDDCLKAETTKRGTLRIRPRGVQHKAAGEPKTKEAV
jgi:hypothetical protein